MLFFKMIVLHSSTQVFYVIWKTKHLFFRLIYILYNYYFLLLIYVISSCLYPSKFRTSTAVNHGTLCCHGFMCKPLASIMVLIWLEIKIFKIPIQLYHKCESLKPDASDLGLLYAGRRSSLFIFVRTTVTTSFPV